jgi:hypothetical protein
MLQNEHWRFARNARNFAENEFIGHQIAQHRDRNFGKLVNDPEQPLGNG